MTEPPEVLPALPTRDPSGHKGTFGTVAVLGGCALASNRMIGAPALVARGALRSGAGLVRLMTPEPILNDALTLEPSATGEGLRTDPDGALLAHDAAEAIDRAAPAVACLAIGPGLGRGDGPRGATFRALQQESCPVVIDADGLNAMSEMPDVGQDLRAQAVLTPHPGEFTRLTRGLGLSDALGLDTDREQAAGGLAQRLGCVVVLKGAGTVVADGVRSWTCPDGHAALATAGTGDVLTGVLSGLVAQFVHPPHPLAGLVPAMAGTPAGSLSLYDTARLAVCAHARAGARWASTHAEAGLLARELADLIPTELSALRV